MDIYDLRGETHQPPLTVGHSTSDVKVFLLFIIDNPKSEANIVLSKEEIVDLSQSCFQYWLIWDICSLFEKI